VKLGRACVALLIALNTPGCQPADTLPQGESAASKARRLLRIMSR
jgi:hypothetical protein